MLHTVVLQKKIAAIQWKKINKTSMLHTAILFKKGCNSMDKKCVVNVKNLP